MVDLNEDTAEQLHDALLPLTEPLHEAFGLAIDDAKTYTPLYKHAGNMAHISSSIIRAGVREHLTNSPADNWFLGGNPDLMGQLLLRHEDEGIDIRVLKSAKQANGIPPAGSNPTRRACWRNTPMLDIGTALPFPGLGFHRLLALWTPLLDGTVSLRVVRPVKEGRYGRIVDVDFSMDLAPTRSDFEKLEFVGEPSREEDLFRHEISDDENVGDIDV